MTKFILHGGRVRIDCKSNDEFLKAIFDNGKKDTKFLVAGFARPKGEWDLAPDQIDRIIQLNKEKTIKFRLATKENLVDELEWADTILLRGGDTLKLIDELKKVKDLKEVFKGKIVAGSSAGFIALAKYFYDQDHDKILDGLNILPIKAISHFNLPNQYNKDCKKELMKLKEYKKKENLETVALKETEFIIREVK